MMTKPLHSVQLTGTATRNSLTVKPKGSQAITLTTDDMQMWPDGQPLTMSVVLVGRVPFELSSAVDLMRRAWHYFEPVQRGKQPTKTGEVHWAFAPMSSQVFPMDRHGQQVSKAINVYGVQEAHDICEARNKASGDDVGV